MSDFNTNLTNDYLAHQRYVEAEAKRVNDAMEQLGFYSENTGGGCTAYVARYRDGGECWITIDEDVSQPERFRDPVLVGVYANYEHMQDGNGAFYRFKTLRQALPMLSARQDDALSPAEVKALYDAQARED